MTNPKLEEIARRQKREDIPPYALPKRKYAEIGGERVRIAEYNVLCELVRPLGTTPEEYYEKHSDAFIIENGGVKGIYLQDETISSFPEDINRLTSLERLALARCGLNTIPKGIFSISTLNYLQLVGNKITILPPEIEKLKNLRSLGLNENCLTKLPTELYGLENLVKLVVSQNKLRRLSYKIYKLKNLKWLNVCANRVSSLPFTITWLNNLEKLFIDRNPIRKLPLGVKTMYKLSHIKINGANISVRELKRFPFRSKVNGYILVEYLKQHDKSKA